METVIGKDILQFSRIRSPALFRQAFEILMQYPACEISYNKLLGQLQEKGNVDLVKYYIGLLKFQNKYPKSKTLFIHWDDFTSLSRDPVEFVKRHR